MRENKCAQAAQHVVWLCVIVFSLPLIPALPTFVGCPHSRPRAPGVYPSTRRANGPIAAGETATAGTKRATEAGAL